MNNAVARFDLAVWFVLDKIMDKALPNSFNKFSYMFDLDVTRQNPITFRDEMRALQYLLENKVIEEVSEKDIIESGERGTPIYKAYESYNLKINKSFYSYYNEYRLKLSSQEKESSGESFIRTRLKDLIRAREIGKTRAKLLLALCSIQPVYRSVLIKKTGTDNLTKLVSETNKESLKNSPFKIINVCSGTITKENSYQLTINSQR